MQLPEAIKAGLRREELIAIVLYTGPMVNDGFCTDVRLGSRFPKRYCTCEAGILYVYGRFDHRSINFTVAVHGVQRHPAAMAPGPI